ncbi:hypothetical protein FCV25MIE_28932, partial [Fagus crenata]
MAVSFGDGEFFRQHRTGYKSIHVTRRANANGKFLEVSEFHSGSRQGALHIPKGETKSGWSRVVNVDMGTHMAREGNLPKISHANHNPMHHVAAAVNSA